MNDQEIYDYDFDAPTYVNFGDYPTTDCDWLDYVDDESDEDDKENEPLNETPSSNGIQRQSLYKKNNVDNNRDNLNQLNSNDAVYEKPATTMKNQREIVLSHMKNLNELQEHDENEVDNEHDEDPLMKVNQQSEPEIIKKPENNAHLKQTMTAYKPKQAQPTNRIPKTVYKAKNVSRPPQTLPKKEPTRPVGPACLTKKPNNNNNAAANTGGLAALQQASTATTVATTAAREGDKTKMASRTAVIGGAAGGGNTARKPMNTVPVAPKLATSQRANMKKEKFEAMQLATAATNVMSLDRQAGQPRPPASTRTALPRSATVGRVPNRKPVNPPPGRANPDARKETAQDKPTGRVPQSTSARAAGLPRSANTNSRSAPKHQPVAWNY